MSAVGEFVGETVGGVLGGITGATAAAEATGEAAALDAAFKNRALTYLQEQERVPSAIREAGQKAQASQYGFTFDEEGNIIAPDEIDLLGRAQDSPLFQAIMGTREAGEAGILRSKQATGLGRSGNVRSGLFNFNQRLKERALLESYNQQVRGLGTLAGTPTNPQGVARAITDVGTARAFEISGPAQVEAQGRLAGLNLLVGGATAVGGFI